MTWPYIPPEIFTRKPMVYHENSDIYQLSLSILFPLLGYTPYENEWMHWRYKSDEANEQIQKLVSTKINNYFNNDLLFCLIDPIYLISALIICFTKHMFVKRH